MVFLTEEEPGSGSGLMKAPVYTIALGRYGSQKKDILISSVNVNDLVYLDNDSLCGWKCRYKLINVMEPG